MKLINKRKIIGFTLNKEYEFSVSAVGHLSYPCYEVINDFNEEWIIPIDEVLEYFISAEDFASTEITEVEDVFYTIMKGDNFHTNLMISGPTNEISAAIKFRSLFRAKNYLNGLNPDMNFRIAKVNCILEEIN